MPSADTVTGEVAAAERLARVEPDAVAAGGVEALVRRTHYRLHVGGGGFSGHQAVTIECGASGERESKCEGGEFCNAHAVSTARGVEVPAGRSC
jgi:hypothetical protein